jgi:hypothetical protein
MELMNLYLNYAKEIEPIATVLTLRQDTNGSISTGKGKHMKLTSPLMMPI